MKTAIYILSSVVVTLIGLIVLLLWGKNSVVASVATSIIAGGLSSLAFSIIRYFDDVGSRAQTQSVHRDVQKIVTEIDGSKGLLRSIQANAIVADNPNLRCVFDRQITTQFTDIIKAIPASETIHIDLIGISLYRFFREQLDNLIDKKGVVLRMIVQDPREPSLEIMVKQEGRNQEIVKKEINDLTTYILQRASKSPAREPSNKIPAAKFSYTAFNTKIESQVELRWFPGVASFTMTRINDIIFVRSRFLEEAQGAPVFFEKYYGKDNKCLLCLAEYFEHAWEISKLPTKDDCSLSDQRLIEKGPK